MTWGNVAVAAAAVGSALISANAKDSGGGSGFVTQDWRTAAQKQDASKLWDEFISMFYGTPAHTETFGYQGSFNPDNVYAQIEKLKRGAGVLYTGTERTEDWEAANREALNETTLGDVLTDHVGEYPELEDLLKQFPQLKNETLGSISRDTVSSLMATLPTDEVISGSGTSYKQRLAQDLTYKKGIEEGYLKDLQGLDTGYLGKTQAAMKPYQNQLGNIIAQQQTGTGLYTPINIGFGGQKVASVVPKRNMAQAEQMMSTGENLAKTNTSLTDLEYALQTAAAKRGFDFNTAHTPNEIENAYMSVLEELMWKLNSGATTTSSTANIPGQSGSTTAANAINAGLNAFAKNYQWQGTQSDTTTPDTTVTIDPYAYQAGDNW